MEKQFKNFRTYEEALEIWKNNIEEFESDYVTFYIPTPEDKEDKLIGIEDVEDDADVDYRMKILAVGRKVERYKEGDTVLLHPNAMRSWFPIFIEGCGYTVMGSSMIVGKIK